MTKIPEILFALRLRRQRNAKDWVFFVVVDILTETIFENEI